MHKKIGIDMNPQPFESKKLSDLRLHKENIKRTFGKDITNNIHKRTLREKPNKSTTLPQQSSHLSGAKKKEQTKDAVWEYIAQIVPYLLEKEHKQGRSDSHDGHQVKQVINKIVHVHQEFGMKEETLFLGLAYFRELRGKQEVEDLLLAGITCLWIAAKYEEIYPPRTKHFLLAAGRQTMTNLVSMESKILECLEFNISEVTPHSILCCMMGDVKKSKEFSMCLYLLQACEYYAERFRSFPASLRALSALRLAEHIFKSKVESECIENVKYEKEELYPCFKELCKLMQEKGVDSTSLVSKFSNQKFHKVARIKIEPR